MTAGPFGEAADDYARLRPGYPPEVFDALLARLPGRRDLAVDLGAGSGQATQALAAHFARVIAVEPDARMQALAAAHPRIAWRVSPAEDAAFEAGSVDAVCSFTAFHWMDAPRVLAAAHVWLRPGGVVFAVLYGPFAVAGAAGKAFQRHRRLWSRQFDRRIGAQADYGAALTRSGLFADVRSHAFAPFTADLAPAEAARLFLTASYAQAHALATGDPSGYAAQLCADLAGDLAQASPGEVSKVRVSMPLGGASAVRRACGGEAAASVPGLWVWRKQAESPGPDPGPCAPISLVIPDDPKDRSGTPAQ